jgi:cleavage stimulation factor subunit 1
VHRLEPTAPSSCSTSAQDEGRSASTTPPPPRRAPRSAPSTTTTRPSTTSPSTRTPPSSPRASDDCTVRLFDIVGANRKAFRTLSDVARVLSVSFHPSGDYLLASTTGRVVRLYDVASGACFKSRDEAAQHAGGVPHAAWSPDGALFATAGEDGDVKLWDGVSQRLTHAFARLNHGAAMLAARFSRNSHYLLATGADGVASLIDVRTHAVLRRLGDASSAVRTAASSNRGAAFSCDERLILLPNAHSSALAVYAARDGRLLEQLRGHNAPVNAVTASPTEPLIVTAGLDAKARLWVASSGSK